MGVKRVFLSRFRGIFDPPSQVAGFWDGGSAGLDTLFWVPGTLFQGSGSLFRCRACFSGVWHTFQVPGAFFVDPERGTGFVVPGRI